MAADLSDYDPETIALIPETKLAIFIISTYGDGDPSDNTAGLWEWIQKTEVASFSNLRYMAFGLGNRHYKYYNKVIDVVVEALDKFSAKSLVPVGKADDAEGTTEEDFISWKDAVFSVFRDQLGYEEKEFKYTPTITVEEDPSLDIIDLHHGEPIQQHENAKTAATNSHIRALTVKHARELFSSPHRNCLHMEFDLTDQVEMNYKTGDHLAVWPSNPDSEVDLLLEVLDLVDRKDVPISIKALESSTKVKIPTPTSTGALLRYYLDICSPVSRDTLLLLASFAPSDEAKSFIVRLGKDKEAYAEYQNSNVITFGRLLQASTSGSVRWSSLPLSVLVETIPLMQPRYYSISSSSIVSPRQVSITAVVSTETLKNNETEYIHGLTTNYLLALKQSFSDGNSEPHPHGLTYQLSGPGEILGSRKVYAHIRKSKFRLPVLASHPIVMVAAGTGIAPFRGFLSERARLKTIGKPVGRMILVFGCRRAGEDYLYKEELKEFQETLGEETLSILTAFSRDGANKFYVQDKITERAEEVCTLLVENNANFYICGSATMAREVAKSIDAALQKLKGWSDEECKVWSGKQKRNNKWQEDVWG